MPKRVPGLPVPTLAEFLDTCDSAFGFLEKHGFAPSEPPSHRSGEPFQRWYTKEPLSLVVNGEGYGTAASTTFEAEGRRAAVIYFVPKAHRPTIRHQSQIEQVIEAAHWVESYCQDLLAGDLSRFDERAEPLPPYLRPSPS